MSQPTAYLDAASQPQLQWSLVAFLDILGFSLMSSAESGAEESQRMLTKIVAAMDDSRRFVRQSLGQEALARPQGWAVKFFSDNLVLGFPVEPADLAAAAPVVLRSAQRYQLRMAVNGFFLRGALTQGPICLTDEIIFGSALIEGYHLESKASIVPRVLVAKPLFEFISQTATLPHESQEAICRDVDGWWFVNYLDAVRSADGVDWELIAHHKSSVLDALSHTTRHDVLPKYGWTCRYHNVFCHWHRDDPGYSDRYRIDRIDEQSTMCRLRDQPSQ